ncbi:MAG: helix-turn-helix domain-containing protein [Pseudomonadales bacterium]|nr:helix-turn-helix domain-containing protein [Pseudomonadales bacterium]
MTKQVLTTKEAARYLGVSAAFLERDRIESARIPYIKLGSRSIRYLQNDLDTFLIKQRRRSTADDSQRSS